MEGRRLVGRDDRRAVGQRAVEVAELAPPPRVVEAADLVAEVHDGGPRERPPARARGDEVVDLDERARRRVAQPDGAEVVVPLRVAAVRVVRAARFRGRRGLRAARRHAAARVDGRLREAPGARGADAQRGHERAEEDVVGDVAVEAHAAARVGERPPETGRGQGPLAAAVGGAHHAARQRKVEVEVRRRERRRGPAQRPARAAERDAERRAVRAWAAKG